jgi:hypothetical protein
MNMPFTRAFRHTIFTYALGACLAAPLAFAAGSGATSMSSEEIQARYLADVERCQAGQTNQDKPTCLQEAGAARDEAKRNRLGNGNQAFDANAMARCEALPLSEREECMLQMSGVGTATKGSVGGGGVLRETEITVPGTPEVQQPAQGLAPVPPPLVPAPSLVPGAPSSVQPAQPAPVTPVPGTGVTQ